MFLLKILPSDTNINFLGKKFIAFILSIFLIIASLALLFVKGLNFGIDFTGGILIETRFDESPDLGIMRQKIGQSVEGDVSLQTFGDDKTILIRIGEQSGNEKDRLSAINNVKKVISDNFKNVDYRKVDYVGPKVGNELISDGILSLLLAFVAILGYIWFRFEWQYGAGAVIALIHDSILTVGFFSLTQLEFNLSSIAAILTIIGYSINDSVVIFDRIRENVRKFRKMPIHELLNKSINQNLSRTILTSLTTLVALLSLAIFGGEVLKSFSMAALFGVAVGTYSSIYIASPILIFMKLRPAKKEEI